MGAAVAETGHRVQIRAIEGVMVCAGFDFSRFEHLVDGAFDGLLGLLVDNFYYFIDGLAADFLEFPAGQLLGGFVEKRYPVFCVNGDDGVAHTRKRYGQQLFFLAQAVRFALLPARQVFRGIF